MNIKLLPCPFCGGEAEFGYYHAYSTDSSFNAVVCTNCDLYMEQTHTPQAVADQWNTRAPATNEEVINETQS